MVYRESGRPCSGEAIPQYSSSQLSQNIKVSPLPVTVYDGKGTINWRGKGKCDHPLLQASPIAQPSKEVGET